MIIEKDIDFNKERRNQESTKTGDVSRKPHKFLGYDCENPEHFLRAQAKTYIATAEARHPLYCCTEDKIGEGEADLAGEGF